MEDCFYFGKQDWLLQYLNFLKLKISGILVHIPSTSIVRKGKCNKGSIMHFERFHGVAINPSMKGRRKSNGRRPEFRPK
eukprot:scaffold16997_cov54-Attheya_sp.AAC.2